MRIRLIRVVGTAAIFVKRRFLVWSPTLSSSDMQNNKARTEAVAMAIRVKRFSPRIP